MASAMGRVGTFVMPYFLFPVYNLGTYYPFLMFSLLCLFCSYACYTLNYDTTGRHLDFELKDIEKE